MESESITIHEAHEIGDSRFGLVKRPILYQIPLMNVTQILLGSTAAMLLAALILSYGAMRGGEAEDGRKHSASELMQENARLQAEIDRLRRGQPMAGAVPQIEPPESMSQTKLREIEGQNALLQEQLAAEKEKKEQAEAETLAMTQRQSGRLNKEERRARLIAQAMLMAQVKEIADEDGIYVIVLDVKVHQSVRLDTELAVRRGTGIIGRLKVSTMVDGNVFADPLPGTFPGGKIDVNVGDELIIPPL